MISAKRVVGWRRDLTKVLLVAPQMPFAWGSNDCCLGLAVPSVNALIGVDLGGPYRGKYKTALGALKALKAEGHDNLVDLAGSVFHRDVALMARVGDLAALKSVDTGWGLGVVMGSRIGVLAPNGFATVGLHDADHIYRVG